MPLTRLVCYCDTCRGERDLPVDDALRHSSENPTPFTHALLSAMLATVQDRGEAISTTTLATKCLRSEVILRTEDYTGDPKRMYAAFRGTMFHGQLEKHAPPWAKEEPRFVKQLILPTGEVGLFSGSPDLVDPVKGVLEDYKFSKENPRYDKPWPDHVAQGMVNRWLCDTGDYVVWRGGYYPLTVDGSNLLLAKVEEEKFDLDQVVEWDIALNRENFVPADWQGIYVVYMDDKGPKPLLCTKSIQVPKKDGNGTKAARVADIWPDDVVEQYVLTNYVKVREAFDQQRAGSPPPIPEAFSNWAHPLCEWCAVKEQCKDYFIRDAVSVQLETRAA